MSYLNRIAITASEDRLEQLIVARLAPGRTRRPSTRGSGTSSARSGR